jgi:hypothetical protein
LQLEQRIVPNKCLHWRKQRGPRLLMDWAMFTQVLYQQEFAPPSTTTSPNNHSLPCQPQPWLPLSSMASTINHGFCHQPWSPANPLTVLFPALITGCWSLNSFSLFYNNVLFHLSWHFYCELPSKGV